MHLPDTPRAWLAGIVQKRIHSPALLLRRLPVLGLLPCVALFACEAELGGGANPSDAGTGPDGGGPDGLGPDGDGTGSAPGLSPPGVAGPEPLKGASGGIRKLTVREYRASVEDLTGLEAPAAESFQPDTKVNGFASIGANSVAFSAQQVERFEQASFEIAAQLFEDETRRAQLVGCTPSSTEDPCVEDFLTRFGRRAFRRPLTPDELDSFSTLTTTTSSDGDVWTGLSYAVAAFLQSPAFLYRTELGDPIADPQGHHHLTAFELAARLSYLITGSTPDEQLLDAAESGALLDDAGLASELERLMASEEAEDALARFLEEQFEVDRVGNIVKVPDEFPEFSPELAEAMEHEMSEVMRDLALREPGDLLTLLTSRETVVNGPLAALYDVPGPASATDWAAATLPEDGERAGLLGFAGFLASHAGPAETSVTQRGFFIMSKLMCIEIPSPPADVDTLLPSPPEGQHATMRERVEQHMSDPSCSNCHAAMDPPGLALEHFDALGVYREFDNGLPIDTTGAVFGQPFDGARELGAILQDQPEVAACLVQRFYEFSLGTQDHRGAPTFALVQAFHDSGRLFPELVRALVMHESFRIVSTPR